MLWSCSAGDLQDKRGTGPNSAKPSPGQADPEPVTGARAGPCERVLQGLSARAWGQLGWEGIWAGSWSRTGSGDAPGHGVTSSGECPSAAAGVSGGDPVPQLGAGERTQCSKGGWPQAWAGVSGGCRVPHLLPSPVPAVPAPSPVQPDGSLHLALSLPGLLGQSLPQWDRLVPPKLQALLWGGAQTA